MTNETKEMLLDFFDELGPQFQEIIIRILREKNKVATGYYLKSMQ